MKFAALFLPLDDFNLMRQFTLPLILIIFLGACTANPKTPEASPSATVTVSQSQPEIPTLERSLLSTPAPAIPLLQTHCPENRDVPLNELGLPDTTYLLLRPSQNQTVEILAQFGADSLPQVITDTQFTIEWSSDFQGISPDSKWLVFRSKDSAVPANEHLWLLSTDGRQQQEILFFEYNNNALYFRSAKTNKEWVVSDLEYGPIFSWSISGDVIVSAQPLGASAIDPIFPVFIFNPFKQDGKLAYETEETAGWNLGLPLGGNYRLGDVTYEIYRDQDGFFLYDRQNENSLRIFRWLGQETWLTWDLVTFKRFRYWQNAAGLENVAIIQDYGLDLASDLDFVTLTQAQTYSNAMKPITIPPGRGYMEENGLPNLSVGWISSNGQQLGLEQALSQELHQFYILDLPRFTLRDYCSVPRNMNSSIHASPEDRFLAWNVNTLNPNNENQSVETTIVLDTATGRLSKLEGFAVIGWGGIEP